MIEKLQSTHQGPNYTYLLLSPIHRCLYIPATFRPLRCGPYVWYRIALSRSDILFVMQELPCHPLGDSFTTLKAKLLYEYMLQNIAMRVPTRLHVNRGLITPSPYREPTPAPPHQNRITEGMQQGGRHMQLRGGLVVHPRLRSCWVIFEDSKNLCLRVFGVQLL